MVPYEEDIARWFDASGTFFADVGKATETLLALVGAENTTAFDLAATELLAVLARGRRQLPPVPDVEAQRHFAAGLARFEDGAEALATMKDDAEMARAIRAIDASGGEFGRMYEARDWAQA